jgi:hypothetical protein
MSKRPELGSDRPSESSLKNSIEKVDGALGGRPATLVYTPDSVGQISLDDLAKGLERSYAPGRPPTPDAPGGDK